MKDQAHISALRAVDNSLRWAVSLAPDSAQYLIDLGRYFLYSDLITLRLQAPRIFERALRAARIAQDTVRTAQALDELGMVSWRRYESLANRRALVDVTGPQPATLLSGGASVARFLDQHTVVIKPQPGLKDSHTAASRFAEGVTSDPGNERVRHHLYMVLAERADWRALAAAARSAVSRDASDAWSWLALGLAEHRLTHLEIAAAAFDSGIAVLPDAHRRRINSLERLLSKDEAARFLRLPAVVRGELEDSYWLTADPLLLTAGNEYQVEFLARVTFAELRWTSHDFDIRGADSDRGMVHIRFGPAPVVAAFASKTSETEACVSTEHKRREGELALDCVDDGGMGDRIELWHYPDLPLHFLFRAPPTFGVATFSGEYAHLAEEMTAAATVSWRNLPIASVTFDSMDSQLTRFRANIDSTDILVFAAIDVSRLIGETAKGIPVEEALVVARTDGRRVFTDTASHILSTAAHSPIRKREWRFRVGRGTLVYSIEAYARSTRRASRARSALTARANIGFEMSDLLLAEQIRPKPGISPGRWTDFDFQPVPGSISQGTPLGLLWETYWLAGPEQINRYRVRIGLKRHAVEGGGTVRTRVLQGIRAALGRTASGVREVYLSYDRETPSNLVVVDYLMLDTSEMDVGAYTVTAEVKDLIANRTHMQERIVRIR